jgi:RNA polymerase sigma-70 factor (ECF subfamily)
MARTPGVEPPTAFRQQLLAAIPRLRRYARTLVFDAASADDLTQTTLERALAHWHQFDQRRDICVWLVGIARHAFIDERRRLGRLTVVEPEELEQTQDARRSEPAPDVALRIDLLAALDRLPVEHRELLLLAGVEQFSYAECAQALNIPIGTVMSRLSRARVALRALLDGTTQPGARSLRRVV